MLLALTRPSRSADLAVLQVDRCQFSPEGVTFLPAALVKQTRQGKTLTEYFSHPSLTIENYAQWPLCDSSYIISLPHYALKAQQNCLWQL